MGVQRSALLLVGPDVAVDRFMADAEAAMAPEHLDNGLLLLIRGRVVLCG